MDFLRFVWRRKWLLIMPVVLSTVIATTLAYSMPVVYRSEVRLMLLPQRLPESFVPSSVKTKLEVQVDSMRQQVLSRTRLERIVNEFALYEEERNAAAIMEDV